MTLSDPRYEKFDVAAWVQVQLTRRNGPSDAWLVEHLIDFFGFDSESARDVLQQAKDSTTP